MLGAFTEKLLSLEENNVRDKITIDAGEKLQIMNNVTVLLFGNTPKYRIFFSTNYISEFPFLLF